MSLTVWLYRLMGGKTKDDHQFEVFDKRLIVVQGTLDKLREFQCEQAEIAHGRFTLLLKSLQRIERKVDEKMSELSDAVAAIGNDVTELQAAGQRVIDLLTQPNPDVKAAVDALKTADAGFDAIRDSLNAAGTAPEPTPEPSPAPEG